MKKLGIWLILGLVLRLVLIPVSLHPDFRAVNLAAYFIAQKGEALNFYDHISHLPRTDHLVTLYGDNLFIYPPLAYLTHAVFNKLFYWAYPQIAFWTLINDIGALRSTVGFAWLMYWLKLPYLLADMFCFWLLWRYLPATNRHRLVWFWWFNPVVIYTCYLMGQFDIFVAMFILLALIYSQRKSWLSAIFLGMGAGFKPFPLLLLLLLPGSKIKNLVIGLGTYVLLIFPYLGSPAFKQYALFASQSDKMFFAKIAISGSQYIPIFLLGLILVYWWNHFKSNRLPIWMWLSAPLLIFYSVTNYHPQWFIWIMPLLVVGAITINEFFWPAIILTGCHLIIILFFENSLNFGLFGINFSLFDVINKYFPADQGVSIIRAFILATSVYLITRIPYEIRTNRLVKK